MQQDNGTQEWKILDSEYIIRRPWLTARRDTVMLPNGQMNDEYYVLEYPTWINVIAIDTEGNFIMERQYRHGLGRMSVEIPAGVAEQGRLRKPLLAAPGYTKSQPGHKHQLHILLPGHRSTQGIRAAPRPHRRHHHRTDDTAAGPHTP